MVGAANRLRSFCGQGGPQTVRFRVLGGGVPGVGQTGGQAPASIGQPAGAEDATASGFVVASREASCQTQTGLGHGGLAWTRERLILAQKRRQGDSLAGSPVVATRLARSSTIAEREARTARTLFECGDADGVCDRRPRRGRNSGHHPRRHGRTARPPKCRARSGYSRSRVFTLKSRETRRMFPIGNFYGVA